jgi:chromosome segregation ATPase
MEAALKANKPVSCDEYIDAANKLRETLEASNKKCEGDIENLKRDSAKEADILKYRNDELTTSLKQLEKTRAELEGKLKDFDPTVHDEYAKAQDANAKLVRERDALRQKISEHEKKINECNKIYQEAEEFMHEREKAVSEVRVCNANIETLKELLSIKVEDIKQYKEAVAGMYLVLTRHLDQAGIPSNIYKATIANAKDVTTALEKALEINKERVNKLLPTHPNA